MPDVWYRTVASDDVRIHEGYSPPHRFHDLVLEDLDVDSFGGAEIE